MKLFTYYSFIFLLITACNNLKTDEKINAEQVNSTIKKSKIKRVLDDDIVAFGYQKGEEAALRIQGLFSKEGQNICSMNLDAMLDSLKLEGISGATLRCEPKFFTHPKEKEMWEAYEQAFKQGIDAPAGVQRLGAKQSYQQLLYAVPIKYEGNRWAMLSILMDKKQLIMLY